MAKNRMTFEKNQREQKKKRKAEEKRAQRQKRKELAQNPALENEADGEFDNGAEATNSLDEQ